MSNSLREKNIEVWNHINNLKRDDWSYPLLVSSDNALKKAGKILYVGQETNGWLDVEESEARRTLTVEEMEKRYLSFFSYGGARKTAFFQFLRKLCDVNYDEISVSAIWANTLLCGRKEGAGIPDDGELIYEISADYLQFLIDYFKPKFIVFACGNDDVHGSIVKKVIPYFEECGKKPYVVRNKDTGYECIVNKEKNCFWTNHPINLRLNRREKAVIEKIKSNMK